MEVGVEGRGFEGLPTKRLSLGWLEKEQCEPPGDGLEEGGGGILSESQEQV